MHYPRIFLLFLTMVAVAGCATMPTGPSVMVLPGSGKSFEAFKNDDRVCRQWAAQHVGANPGQTYNENLAGGAAAGTLIGAGLGAALGSASGDAGTGAAIGAVSGLLMGTSMAAGPASATAWQAQRRYDIAYEQCMYLKGNRIPGVVENSRQTPSIPPPPPPPQEYPPEKGPTTGGTPSPPPPLP